MAESNNSVISSKNWSLDFIEFYKSIQNCNNVSDVKVTAESDKIITISLNIKVNLPLRRSKMKVDIKEIEPILLMCLCKEIKYIAPTVFSGRSDFPVENLPHAISIGGTSIICLHRGNINDWYMEHSISQFINRIQSWFSDAASGRLIKNGDEFEPMLINEKAADIIYSYDNIISWIGNYWDNHNKEKGYAFITYKFSDENLNFTRNDYSIKITGIYEKSKMKEIIKNLNVQIKKHNRQPEYIGILTWGSKSFIYNKYFKFSCGTLEELINLNNRLGNSFKRALNVIKNSSVKQEFSLVITAVNRPTNLIGYSTNIELLNFVFQTKKIYEFKSERYDLSKFAAILKQLDTFNSNIALKISGNDYIYINKKILFVGVGALGSKIIFHLARNGFRNITVIDNDIMYPHNLARHDLYAESIGRKKSSEIVSKLNEMYLDDISSAFNSIEESFIYYAETHDLTSYDVILDFTASKSILSYLTDTKSKLPNYIIRGELGDNGKLGLLMVEGKNREPRIDELQMILFKNAFANNELSEWLRNYKHLKEEVGEAQFEDVIIGMGCNTNTMKLSDDIISNHASIFSNYIKQLICGKINDFGTISINYFDENDYFKNCFSTINVKSFICCKSNNSEWTIKLYTEAYEKVMSLITKNNNIEVGGILLGHVDLYKKFIYVIDVFIPKDNRSSSNLFYKGSEGTLEYLKEISYKTGGMINYVGDWHTHPNFSVNMSNIDRKALEQLKEDINDIKYPAHIMIFNNNNFSSYIL